MSREESDNEQRKIGIYRLDIATQSVTELSKDNTVDFLNQTYIGNDPSTRFALWKMQIDGSDSFTFYGQESATDRNSDNIYSPRVVRSGPYKDYVLMGQGARSNHPFVAEGDIVMMRARKLLKKLRIKILKH